MYVKEHASVHETERKKYTARLRFEFRTFQNLVGHYMYQFSYRSLTINLVQFRYSHSCFIKVFATQPQDDNHINIYNPGSGFQIIMNWVSDD